MTTPEVADRLIALCRAGKWVDAITELYAPDVRQAENGQTIPADRTGITEACRAWVGSRDIHGADVLSTHVGPDSFVVEWRYDVTPHATKQRHQWTEAPIYRVRDGRISDARFFYKPAEA
jgi:hypothetical protein